MDRRTYLQQVGLISGTVASIGLAGCLGDSSDAEAANEFGYETITQSGVDVPLVPVTDAGEWYHDETLEVVFADTRHEGAYHDAHIADAVFSPAADGLAEDDPLEALDTETQIVTYCVCPHSLATLRGASLVESGYVHTYALDEGLQGWVEAGLPMAGNNPEQLHLDGEYHTETD